MKQTIILVAALIFFVSVGVSSLVNRDNKIEFQKVELQSKQAEIKQLQLDFESLTKKQQEVDATNQQEIEKLNKEKEELLKRQQELEQQLSAKREAQRLASQKLQSAASVTATADAAPSGSCIDWVRQAGITEIEAAMTLIGRESGCRPTVEGSMTNLGRAYGIPQALPGHKMASHGADWQTNPVTQLRWMKSYVEGRYGSFSAALAHSYANNWY